MANFCENCGSPLKSDIKFCPNCGAPLKDAGAAVPAAPAVSSEPGTRQDIPHSDYNRPKEFARGGTGPKYEPDEDFRSMFLRFDNRLNRKRYIKRSLALGGIAIILIIIMSIISALTGVNPVIAGALVPFVLLIPSYSLTIRRLHDLNRPGWWCIPGIIQAVLHPALIIHNPANMSSLPSPVEGVLTLINLALAVYLLFFKGTDGPNRYGPDPLETQN